MTTQTEAANRPDDGLIELTGPELLVLLSLNEGSAATRTRENLRLPDVPADSPLLAAGLSSLVVRRLARVEGEVLAPVGNVVPLTRVLTTATEWVEAAAIADERTNAALLVGAQGGAVVLEPRPFGIWHVRPLQMGDPLPDAASRFVRAAFAQLPGRPFGGSIKVVDASGARTAAVRVESDGTWEMTSGAAGEEPAPSPIAPDPTFGVLATAVA
ncbi:hypothetical protein JN535_00625 [Cellulosimicrobium cellulans]|uniref:hypothetical protein n=1 Tax=Cellulosimicrobium cellulans TaxID=1710 RepID=UPI00196600D9|nr:hypothetical protein [Cellulosimicrobium cellulans]MBN0038673.1 hypothetical protein [Cellulosimicrobium cellulans]